jgi:hypothetical protein
MYPYREYAMAGGLVSYGVLRLMKSSTFEDCWTGRSAGLSPLALGLTVPLTLRVRADEVIE